MYIQNLCSARTQNAPFYGLNAWINITMNVSLLDMSPHSTKEREDEGSGALDGDVKSCEMKHSDSVVNIYAGMGRFHQRTPQQTTDSVSVSADTVSDLNAAAKRAANSSDDYRSTKKTCQGGSEQFYGMHGKEQRTDGARYAPTRTDLTRVNPPATPAFCPPGPYSVGPQYGLPETLRGVYSINDNRESNRNVPSAGFLDQPLQRTLPSAMGYTELAVDDLRQQLARSQCAAANVAFSSPFSGRSGLEALSSPNFPLGGLQGFAAQQQFTQSFPGLPYFSRPWTAGSGGNYLDTFQFPTTLNVAHPNALISSLMAASQRPNGERFQDLFTAQLQDGQHHGVDIAALLARRAAAQSGLPSQDELLNFLNLQAQRPRSSSTQQEEPHGQQQVLQHYPEQNRKQLPPPPRPALPDPLELPPCNDGRLESFVTRTCFPLAIDEDPNWLSEFHCFVRAELVEVFRSNQSDVRTRNNSIGYQQVGIRCRFCAHLPSTARSGRSSAFPSSMRQIYQSFTMMLRDHFGSCSAMPCRIQDKFMLLKDKPSQGATDSKRFWTYSAQKIGLVNSSEGLTISAESRLAGFRLDPFGIVPGERSVDESLSHIPLVLPSDRPFVAEFLFILLSQVQPIRLMESECIGNRRNLRVGMPGFGCRFCCRHRRFGLSRMFPARRRTLPGKINDLYVHLSRCNVCPPSVKDELETSRQRMEAGFQSDQGGTRDFFNRVWVRIGHDGEENSEDVT